MKKLLSFLLFALAASVCSATASFTIRWSDQNPNSRINGFVLERAPAGPPEYVVWTIIATTGPSVKSFVDTGLADNTMYQYRVKTYNSSISSKYSNIVAKVTPR